jgi:hypothetical protein
MFHESWLNAGNVTIYHADRIRNITAAPPPVVAPAPDVLPDSDNRKIGVHMRTSYPCQRVTPQHAGWCSLIDGPGLYWTEPFISRNKYGDRHWGFGPQAAVFALNDASVSGYLIVANAHAHPSEDFVSLRVIDSLVKEVNKSWSVRGRRLYPPVVAGDFNASHEDMLIETHGNVFNDYQIAGFDGADNILIGRSNQPEFQSALMPQYSSSAYPDISNVNHDPNFCGTSTTALSDHCALFVDISPCQASTCEEQIPTSSTVPNPPTPTKEPPICASPNPTKRDLPQCQPRG